MKIHLAGDIISVSFYGTAISGACDSTLDTHCSFTYQAARVTCGRCKRTKAYRAAIQQPLFKPTKTDARVVKDRA